jgi:tRNA(Ile)-lysidine synthase TilS/MesJ
MTLLYELKKYEKFSPIKFNIHAIKINIGFEKEEDVTIIRPFYNIDEHLINSFVKEYNIPIVKSNCTVDKNTKREEIKNFLSEVYPRFKGSKKSIEQALNLSLTLFQHNNTKEACKKASFLLKSICFLCSVL